MEITDDIILSHSQDTSWRKYLKSIVIEPGIALNESAAAFFVRMDGSKTLAEICKEVSSEFDVDYDTCRVDAGELVQEMFERGFVVRVEPA